MADTISKEARSRNMSKIRSKNTKPEEYLRKLLFSRGYRYRKNVGTIVGHPDIWMARYNLAIFVNGCFWHRHTGCKYAYMPKSNVEFWTSKFDRNVERDKYVIHQLGEDGIRCLVVWECTIRKMLRSKNVELEQLDSIIEFIESKDLYNEI